MVARDVRDITWAVFERGRNRIVWLRSLLCVFNEHFVAIPKVSRVV